VLHDYIETRDTVGEEGAEVLRRSVLHDYIETRDTVVVIDVEKT